MNAAIMPGVLPLEAALGWASAGFRRIGHTVVWMGTLIGGLGRVLNWIA